MEAITDLLADPGVEYAQIVTRVRELIESCVPAGDVVAVVSKGDSELLRLNGRIGWHFPRASTGAYAGHYPADDAEAIERLEAIRAAGANFLVFPATAFWWLDHYSGFKHHIETRYRRVGEALDTAIIFSLAGAPPVAPPTDSTAPDPLVASIRGVVSALLPGGANVVVISDGDGRLLDLGSVAAWQFPTVPQEDDNAAIAALGGLCAEGADYLLVPQGMQPLLDRYPGLVARITRSFALVTRQENVCTIYDLRSRPPRRRGNRRTNG